jgi:sialate O-acetylesterase
VNLRGLWDFTLVRRKFGDFSESNDYSLKRTPPLKAEWSKLMVPGSWEDQGYANYDGSTWYRKQFFIPKELDGQDLILLMGKIDDFDQTYLNGKLVGSTNNYDKLRIYTVPSEMFKAGAMNILLVYVDDPQGLGGLRQGPLGLMKQSDFTRYMRWRQ